ncbi:putative ATP-binding cassette transporter [Aquamicrobium ahrensii]|uniref:ATP-binding cassette transporter n=1 Tax=Aquamicrobium ahrensii TaxID=469551 RepID=A0ABV2KN00_9HYPH
MALRVIDWTRDFYDALQQMNAAAALHQTWVFAVIVAVEAARNLCSIYFRKMLEIRWREALTARLLDKWLDDGRYHRTQEFTEASLLDNPDQRIAEDSRIFLSGNVADSTTASGFIPLSLDIVTRTVGLISYASVLWSLSSFALDLGALGIDWSLPRYMVWLAFAYVFLAIAITHFLGRPLKELYFKQQQREADYRFGLVHIRRNADQIAQLSGAAAERRELDTRFDRIIDNWRRLIGQELRLSSFTYPYYYTALRIPTFLAMPAYFAGALTFGGMMQISSAFAKVVTTLSWFIFSYRPLSELAAAAKRLGGLIEFLDAPAPQGEPCISVEPSSNGTVRADRLVLATPATKPFLSLPGLHLGQGETLWLSGPSGIGKTTLGKALAGLWRHGQGHVLIPQDGFFVLPQHPYLPLGDAVEAACYPRPVSDFSRQDIDAALHDVGLEPDIIRAMRPEDLTTLSGGELQRLILARLFLHKPRWVVMDEATSALDRAAEEEIFRALCRKLKGTSFIVISHRRPEGLGPVREMDLSVHTAQSGRPFEAAELREAEA